MLYCNKCRKYFQSLGYSRHRQSHYEARVATGYKHNGIPRRIRHKCYVCGVVRLEYFMQPLGYISRWGRRSWICFDKKDVFHTKEHYLIISKI